MPITCSGRNCATETSLLATASSSLVLFSSPRNLDAPQIAPLHRLALHRLPSIVACAFHTTMSTPSHPLSSAPLANAGPPRTVLQKLLEEIHGSATPTVLRDLGTSHASPKHHCESTARPPSVWIGGAPVAQDARKKLWAADEARLRKTSQHSIDGATDGRPLLSSQRPLAPPDVPASKGASGTQEPDSSPALNSVIFDGSATAPTVGVPKARTKSLASISSKI